MFKFIDSGIFNLLISKIQRIIASSSLLLLLCSIPLSSSFAQSPTSDIFEGLFISNTTKGQLVKIKLSLPVTYISHFPVKSGRYVSIKLRPLLKNALDDYLDSRMAILSPSSDTATPLLDINYEKDELGNLVLEAKFKTTQVFKVQQVTNTSISIFIYEQDSSQKRTPERQQDIRKYYVVNLQSTLKPTSSEALQKLKKFSQYKIYTTKSVIAGKTWYRLRMGFFTDKDSAFNIKEMLSSSFPSAWVARTKSDELALAEEWFIEKDKLEDSPVTAIPSIPEPRESLPEKTVSTQGSGQRAEKLMEIARQAMVDSEYKKAIRYYKKVLELDTPETRQDALEYLGVAREKNKQLAHAKAEYQKYLKLYPDNEGASRVRQRLNAILTARKGDKKKIAEEKKTTNPRWQHVGSISQFYLRQDVSTDFSEDININDSLNTDVALSGRYRGENYDMRSQLTVNHRYDFNDVDDPNKTSVYSLYLDVTNRNSNLSGRIGRQTHNGDGVLGRFDGILLRYRINNDWKLNAIGGYPVELTRTNISNKETSFYGLSLDAESLIKDWKFTLYGINQTSYNLTDREAIGVEAQYRDKNKSLYTTVDYDVFYGMLNNATMVGSVRFKNQASINLQLDYRNSPFILTTNALIGQTATNLEELLQSYSEDQVKDLALDRTARYKSVTLSGSLPLNSKYQVNGDISATSLSSTVSSGGVEGFPASGTEYYASAQLIATNFFSDKDTTIFGVRYGDTATTESASFTLSTRLSPAPKWRILPRITVDKRTTDTGTEKTTYKPLLKVDYRYKKNTKFHVELGYDDATIKTDIAEDQEQIRFIYAGYIYDF